MSEEEVPIEIVTVDESEYGTGHDEDEDDFGEDEGEDDGVHEILTDKEFEFMEVNQGCFALFWEKLIIFLSYILLLIAFPCQVRVVSDYERGIIFRLGKFGGCKGPGLFFLLPFVDSMVKVDIRVKSLDVVPQTVITSDSVTITIDAVVYYRISNPDYAVIRVNNYQMSTLYLAQTTLRSVVGQSTLDEVLGKRQAISAKMKNILDVTTERWGVDITGVEIKDCALPQSMRRAMAAQAEAERERRAKITLANAEFQASEKLSQAAKQMSETPGAIQLRYLQTLVEISADRNHTSIIPLPIKLLMRLAGRDSTGNVDE